MLFSSNPAVLPIVSPNKWVRVVNIFIMVILPTIYFCLAFGLIPGWQSGELQDYAALLLIPKVSFVFYVWLIYSMSSFTLLQVWPEYFAPIFLIRLGIYTGSVLALQYSILAVMYGHPLLISELILVGIYWLIKLIKNQKIKISLVVSIALILVISFLLPGQISETIFRNTFIPLASSPFGLPLLCLNISCVYSWKLFRYFDLKVEFNGFKFGLIGAWLAGYTASWVNAIIKMFDVYQTLPKTDPNCYIVTVAAKGHPSFVGSWQEGNIWVNYQLQTYKAIELAMMALVPGVHKQLRGIYDLIGPKLARRMDHPISADIAYLLLKPAELLGHKLLILLIPECKIFISQIYKKRTVPLYKFE